MLLWLGFLVALNSGTAQPRQTPTDVQTGCYARRSKENVPALFNILSVQFTSEFLADAFFELKLIF